MPTKTIHICTECDYYQEPFNDYPDRGICECMNCEEWVCDEHQRTHALSCMMDKSKSDLIDYACECCYG
jgi:hypothetical protein